MASVIPAPSRRTPRRSWTGLTTASASTPCYRLYGTALRCSIPLPAPILAQAPHGTPIEIVETAGSQPLSSAALQHVARSQPGAWFHHVRLPEGSDYLRWTGLFEFLVSHDGRHIRCRALDRRSSGAFQTYLLGQVLSFALLKRGLEPLHATVLELDGRGVALLGGCGTGKSTLAAAFLRQGGKLLTDDLLVARSIDGRWLGYPGPGRLKLFPEVKNRLLPKLSGHRMNPGTSKLVLPLPPERCSEGALPLQRIYVLHSTERWPSRITIRRLPARRACLALLRNTFNHLVSEPARLTRQLEFAVSLARSVPVKSLSYPRRLATLPALAARIRADLE